MSFFTAKIGKTAVLEAKISTFSKNQIVLTLFWLAPINIPDHWSDIEHIMYLNLVNYLPEWNIWHEIRLHGLCRCKGGEDRSGQQWTQMELTTHHAEELYDHLAAKMIGNPTLQFITG